MINLAGPSAKFDSSGIPGIARIPPDSGRNQWRTVKTSKITSPNDLGKIYCDNGELYDAYHTLIDGEHIFLLNISTSKN